MRPKGWDVYGETTTDLNGETSATGVLRASKNVYAGTPHTQVKIIARLHSVKRGQVKVHCHLTIGCEILRPEGMFAECHSVDEALRFAEKLNTTERIQALLKDVYSQRLAICVYRATDGMGWEPHVTVFGATGTDYCSLLEPGEYFGLQYSYSIARGLREATLYGTHIQVHSKGSYGTGGYYRAGMSTKEADELHLRLVKNLPFWLKKEEQNGQELHRDDVHQQDARVR